MLKLMNDRIQKILDILSEEFPEPKSELQYASVFQLLVAVILSAQCTDKRVNSVTPMLFEKAPDAFSMAALPVEDIENIIHSCGFYKNKAVNIRKCSEILVSEYGGEVPGELDKLVRLPGVGNKTASVILAVGFNLPAFAVDTHIFRVSHRLALSEGKNPDKVSEDLKKLFPEDLWGDCHHYLLLHGRYICKAISPQCKNCPLGDLCPSRRT